MSDANFSADDLALLSSNEQAPASASAGADASPAASASDGAPAAQAKQADPASSAPAKAADESGKDGEPAPAKKPRSQTVLDDDGGDDASGEAKDEAKGEKDKAGEQKPKDAKPEVDDGWREDFAQKLLDKLKGKIPDNKLDARRAGILNQLKRYKSPFDYMVSGFAAQERIRSGELRSKRPDDASDEEVAEWRKENGIPEKAADYDIPKIPGHKWTDADKPYIEDFKEIAHKGDYTQDQVNLATEWYANLIQKQTEGYVAKIQETDEQDSSSLNDQLRGEWGGEYKTNKELLKRLLGDRDVMPEETAKAILSARAMGPNGESRRLMNDYHFIEMLRQFSIDSYGDGGFVRGDAKTAHRSVIEEGEAIMNTDRDRYFREGWDQKVLDARQAEEEAGSRRRRRAA